MKKKIRFEKGYGRYTLPHLGGLLKTNKGAKKSIGTMMMKNFQISKIPLASSDFRIVPS